MSEMAWLHQFGRKSLCHNSTELCASDELRESWMPLGDSMRWQ
jgi:hypothetical protein